MINFIVKNRNSVFICYCIGSTILLIIIESVFNGGLIESLKYFSIPLAVLICLYVLSNLAKLQALLKCSKASICAYTFLLVLVMSLMNWPYFMLFNALLADGTRITYSGNISDKFITHGKGGKGYHIAIIDDISRKELKFNCTEKDYERYKEGEKYSRTFCKGKFGVPYKWRYIFSHNSASMR